jgi:hypothetical protein
MGPTSAGGGDPPAAGLRREGVQRAEQAAPSPHKRRKTSGGGVVGVSKGHYDVGGVQAAHNYNNNSLPPVASQKGNGRKACSAPSRQREEAERSLRTERLRAMEHEPTGGDLCCNGGRGGGGGFHREHERQDAGRGAPGVLPPQKVMDLLRQGFIRGGSLRELVESTVREILASDKTERCLEQERKRNTTKEIAVLSRLIRDAAHNRDCLRPNALVMMGQVAFLCRKNRQVISLRACGEAVSERVVEECTDAIAGLLLKHGGPRVARQIQNSARYREFITSMLFLMRAGISYQGRQILPRLEILHQLLPLQVLLPPVFKIRAKSITEGICASPFVRCMFCLRF